MNSKVLSYVTSGFGLVSLIAGFFSPAIQGYVVAHPAVALIVAGTIKLLSSFNGTTPAGK